MLTHDPALADLLRRLDDGLRALYGGRYHGLLLCGSHARGDADEGSDVDVLVLLDGPVDPFREIVRSEPVHWPLALEYDVALAIVPVDRERFARGAEAFLVNAARDGRGRGQDDHISLSRSGRRPRVGARVAFRRQPAGCTTPRFGWGL